MASRTVISWDIPSIFQEMKSGVEGKGEYCLKQVDRSGKIPDFLG